MGVLGLLCNGSLSEDGCSRFIVLWVITCKWVFWDYCVMCHYLEMGVLGLLCYGSLPVNRCSGIIVLCVITCKWVFWDCCVIGHDL